MAARKCPACGKTNPHFFTHCVSCGAILADQTRRNAMTTTILKTVLVLVVSILLLVFVIVPAIQYSGSFGRNFSETVAERDAAAAHPVPEYPPGIPAANRDLEVTLRSAHDGQNTYNSNKFFIVTVSLTNRHTGSSMYVSSSDFVLVDSENTEYIPYGIGSKVIYDLGPSRNSTAELTFVIPQNVHAERIRFTFPGSLSQNRDVVAFVI